MRSAFVSAVTDEFEGYREPLRRRLSSHVLAVHVQSDFPPSGRPALLDLDDYIAGSDYVIQLIGDMVGRQPPVSELQALKNKNPEIFLQNTALNEERCTYSYTQWEAYLAVHYGKPLLIFRARPEAERSDTYVKDSGQIAAQ